MENLTLENLAAKVCENPRCGKSFTLTRYGRKYCSVRCRKTAERRKERERDEKEISLSLQTPAQRLLEKATKVLVRPTLEETLNAYQALVLLRPEYPVVITGALPEGWNNHAELMFNILPSPHLTDAWVMTTE
jgi:hypothetical protein